LPVVIRFFADEQSTFLLLPNCLLCTCDVNMLYAKNSLVIYRLYIVH